MGAYNTGKFNIGKFNIKSNNNITLTANSEINYFTKVEDILIQKELGKVGATIDYEASATSILEIKLKETAELAINFDASAVATSIILIEDLNSEITFEAEGIGSLLGEEYIEIKGFVLRPGQEIEINTCDLTATINGENAIHLLTEEGDFFDFLPGENDIKIDAVGAGSVSIDTYWKDRWL
ncbi:phage distal tail protein [Peptoniphilus lacydonensis]|uniref:phage distal tail protein n=1 Tax=Peptoniphilus lacydonensis TaxID=1673725 RepID=UPI0008D913CD|nr:phage tail domain-containing protein [Peptoniphilus lacydonensis]